MNELLQIIVTLLPKIKDYASLLPEAYEVVKAIYESVKKIIEIAKAQPLDEQGEAALDALIEWQSHTPWGDIEYESPTT